MIRNSHCHVLAAVVMGSVLISSATTSAHDRNAGEQSQEPETRHLVTPEKIKRRDANPEIRSEKDLWKLEYLGSDYRKTNPKTERILAALNEETECDFVGAPLTEVLEHLGEVHDIEIAIDIRALADAKIAADTRLSNEVREVTLQSALRLLLSDVKLDYVIENEVLLITTPEKAASKLDTRVYDTRLLKTIPADKLAEIIVATVAPNSWRGADGPGAVESLPGCLIVYQTQKVHAEIIDLLSQLVNHSDNPLFKKSRRADRDAAR